jgi:WD40 repeat protein
MNGWRLTGSLNSGRVRHSATLLRDGTVLVCGGVGGLRSAELFHPTNGVWTITGSTFYDYSDAPATLVQNGSVLVAGGSQSGGVQFSGAEVYDPATRNWSVMGGLNVGHPGLAATLLPNGQVLVAGGVDRTAELYDPVARVWRLTGALQFSRQRPTATPLNDGRGLVVGGWDSDVTNLGDLNTAELYDPSTGQWTVTGSLFYPRGGHTGTLLKDGKVLVAGGWESLDSVEIYDPASGNWYSVGKLTTGRAAHAATLLHDGRVLVEGGQPRGFEPLPFASAESYDPTATFSCQQRASMWREQRPPRPSSSCVPPTNYSLDGPAAFSSSAGRTIKRWARYWTAARSGISDMPSPSTRPSLRCRADEDDFAQQRRSRATGAHPRMRAAPRTFPPAKF